MKKFIAILLAVSLLVPIAVLPANAQQSTSKITVQKAKTAL